MATIIWFVLGLLVAGFAKVVFWEDAPIGLVPVLAAGVVGGMGGGFLRDALFGKSEFDTASLAMVIVGAAAIVYLYYQAIGRKHLAAGRVTDVGQRRAA